jgi:hypothetical protein
MVVTAFDPVRGKGAELARFDLLPDASAWMDSDHSHICQISPDGTRLAIARGPEAPIEIHSLLGGQTQIVRNTELDKITVLSWAADEKGVFVTKQLYDGSELFYVDLQGGTHSLWRSHGGHCFGKPSPDRRHLSIFDAEQSNNAWMMENF